MKKAVIAIGISILFIFSTAISATGFSLKKVSVDNHTLNEKFDSDLPIIMITGYWNPTGQMIAPFSNDTFLNPMGWKGAHWEDRGYDIMALLK